MLTGIIQKACMKVLQKIKRLLPGNLKHQEALLQSLSETFLKPIMSL